MPEFDVSFDREFDLRTTMDIQIPALEWTPYLDGYRTVFFVSGAPTEVLMRRVDDRTVRFKWNRHDSSVDSALRSKLRDRFTFFLDEIEVSNPLLRDLSSYYGDILYMRTDAYRALLTTILSQNRTGEITRDSFFDLAQAAPELTPTAVSQMDESTLKDAIRSAGPYKSDYILQASEKIAEEYDGDLDAVVNEPTETALELLTALPGVGHKTAACVLVYSSLKRDILPVDTHLWRVAQRTGLVEVDGKTLTKRTRDEIVSQFLEQSADGGYAHLLLVLLGRNTCSAQDPSHDSCPLEAACPRNSTPGI